jgi:hypothetical protein
MIQQNESIYDKCEFLYKIVFLFRVFEHAL